MALPAHTELDSTEDVFLQDDLGPTIAEHAMQCNSLFRKYLALPGIARDPTIMDDQLARFTLWTKNMDVFGPLNVSLDYRLRYSPTVVDIIHQLLDVICDSLASLKPIDDPPQTPSRKKQRISEKGDAEVTKRADDDSMDEDINEDQEQENISIITYDIGGTVTRLFRLSSAIRKSAKDKRTSRIGRYGDDEEANTAINELRLYTECYIRFRYPQAPEALLSALVEANALRLRRLHYQRSHRRRITLSVQRPQANLASIQLPTIKDSAPAVRFAPSVQQKSNTIDERSKPTGPPPAPVTYATTARQTAVEALYANSTVDIPRAKSVLVNNKLSFPPVPTTDECPYCGVIIEFRGTAKSAMWKDHVIRDLEPFVCIFAHCADAGRQEPGSLTFETSKAWMSHIQNAHGYAWECRAPSHDPVIFEQEVQYQEHSCKEHGVPEAHAGTLSRAARRPVLKKIGECPFGDDFQHPEKVESNNNVFSSEALHLHIAAHMKEIALLALQKLPSDVDDNTGDFDSDQPLDDDGFGVTQLRGSMYSVLDDESLDFQDGAGGSVLSNRKEDIGPSVERLDLEDKDASGLPELHVAVLCNNLPLVRSLIAQGTSLRSRASDGKTALHCASQDPSQGLDIMKMLLESGNIDINSKDDNGQTPLHLAAENSFADGIKLMIEYGADINITDNFGFSPYLWAVVARQASATSVLLSIGADVNSTSADGKSALAWAASLGSSSTAELLVENGAHVMLMTRHTQMVPLEEAAACGSVSTVVLLLKSGADPNYRDRQGFSAIHWAAEEAHLDVVQLLLGFGADIEAVSSYGTSPLHCAANGGDVETVKYLLQRGANPLKSTSHGWTPLHNAAFMGHHDVVKCLLEDHRINSSASSPDDAGWSALHLAVHSRDLDTVKILLDNSNVSESVVQCDMGGFTAEKWLDFVPTNDSYKIISDLAFGKSRCCRAVTGLRQAAVGGNFPMVKLFLNQGDDPNGKDSGNRTALHYAANNGFTHIMEILLERGANPNILPEGRRTWEEFVSDEIILKRLRQYGYKTQSIDPETEHQIRLAFKVRREPSILDRPTSLPSLTPKYEEVSESAGEAKKPYTALGGLFKRLKKGYR